MFRLKEGVIGSHEVFSLIVILLITKLFLGVPRAMILEGGSAGWLLILLSAGAASIGVFIIVKLLKKFPSKNLIEMGEIVWGKPGGILVALMMAGIFLFYSAVVIREFSETILTTVLPRTPISVIIFMFLFAMVLGSYNGLEVITRSTLLLFPFIIVGIFSIVLLTSSYLNINNLFPILGTSPMMLSHVPGRTSLFLEVIFVLLIASNIDNPEKIPLQIWKGFLFSVFIFLLVEIFYICVLSIEAGSKLYIPLFQLARIIYMGRFVQRIESIYVFVWFFSGALQLTITFYGAVTALSRGFKIPIYQPLVFPLALLVFSLSFIPDSFFDAISLDVSILREYGGIFGFGIPAAILLTSIIRKKGGGTPESPKSH